MTLVACVRIPNFAIAVARRDAPNLAAQPLLLYTTDRAGATVYAAAEEVGMAAGIPLRQALARCPGAVCRPADPPRDGRTLDALVTLLGFFRWRVAPATPRRHDGSRLRRGSSEHQMGQCVVRKMLPTSPGCLAS